MFGRPDTKFIQFTKSINDVRAQARINGVVFTDVSEVIESEITTIVTRLKLSTNRDDTKEYLDRYSALYRKYRQLVPRDSSVYLYVESLFKIADKFIYQFKHGVAVKATSLIYRGGKGLTKGVVKGGYAAAIGALRSAAYKEPIAGAALSAVEGSIHLLSGLGTALFAHRKKFTAQLSESEQSIVSALYGDKTGLGARIRPTTRVMGTHPSLSMEPGMGGFGGAGFGEEGLVELKLHTGILSSQERIQKEISADIKKIIGYQQKASVDATGQEFTNIESQREAAGKDSTIKEKKEKRGFLGAALDMAIQNSSIIQKAKDIVVSGKDLIITGMAGLWAWKSGIEKIVKSIIPAGVAGAGKAVPVGSTMLSFYALQIAHDAIDKERKRRGITTPAPEDDPNLLPNLARDFSKMWTMGRKDFLSGMDRIGKNLDSISQTIESTWIQQKSSFLLGYELLEKKSKSAFRAAMDSGSEAISDLKEAILADKTALYWNFDKDREERAKKLEAKELKLKDLEEDNQKLLKQILEDQQKMNLISKAPAGKLGMFRDSETKTTPKGSKPETKVKTTTDKSMLETMLSWGLGDYTAKQESGGKSTTVSTGRGDAGGKSYGKFQLSTGTGTLQNFLATSGLDKQFEGLQPGSAEFDARWKELSANMTNFADIEREFMLKTHMGPLVDSLNKAGMDISSRTKSLKEVLFSTATQYGPERGASIVGNALRGMDASKMTDEEIIKSIQEYKLAHLDSLFKSSAASIRASVADRIVREKEELSKMASLEAKKNASLDFQAEPTKTFEALLEQIKLVRDQTDSMKAKLEGKTSTAMNQVVAPSSTSVSNSSSSTVIASSLRHSEPTLMREQDKGWGLT